jgi:hypothetical protein
MLNIDFRPWLVGGWLATVAVIVSASVAAGASVSTLSLLLALGVAPVIIPALVRSKTSPTVAEILYAVDTKNARS